MWIVNYRPGIKQGLRNDINWATGWIPQVDKLNRYCGMERISGKGKIYVHYKGTVKELSIKEANLFVN